MLYGWGTGIIRLGWKDIRGRIEIGGTKPRSFAVSPNEGYIASCKEKKNE
jgi:hypothetical protein